MVDYGLLPAPILLCVKEKKNTFSSNRINRLISVRHTDGQTEKKLEIICRVSEYDSSVAEITARCIGVLR